MYATRQNQIERSLSGYMKCKNRFSSALYIHIVIPHPFSQVTPNKGI